jgi:hypothetical protein
MPETAIHLEVQFAAMTVEQEVRWRGGVRRVYGLLKATRDNLGEAVACAADGRAVSVLMVKDSAEV